MAGYKFTFDDVASGVSDSFKTIAAIITANFTTDRIRIRALQIGPSDNVPPDANVSIQLKRIADASAGTAGTAARTVAGSALARVNTESSNPGGSAKSDYSVEPTAYEAEALWQTDFNAHAGAIKEWSRQNAPVLNGDQLMGLLATSRNATAIQLSGTIEFDAFI